MSHEQIDGVSGSARCTLDVFGDAAADGVTL